MEFMLSKALYSRAYNLDPTYAPTTTFWRIWMSYRIDYTDLQVVEVILNSEPIVTYSKLAQILGHSKESFQRRLKRVRKLGFKFTVNIDVESIGLSLGIIIAKGHCEKTIPQEYLSTKMKLLPSGYLLAYYLPYGRGLEKRIEVIGKDNVEEYFKATLILGSRPSLTQYYDSSQGILGVSLNKIYRDAGDTRIILRASYHSRERVAEKSPISELDLKILSILEEDALTTPGEIASKLNKSRSKILHRLRMLSKYIISYSLRETPWTRNLNMITVNLVETPDKEKALQMAAAFHRNPLVTRIYASLQENKVLIIMSADFNIITRQYELFQKLGFQGYVKEYKTWITTRDISTDYTIIEKTRYSKYERRWLDLLKEKLFD